MASSTNNSSSSVIRTCLLSVVCVATFVPLASNWMDTVDTVARAAALILGPLGTFQGDNGYGSGFSGWLLTVLHLLFIMIIGFGFIYLSPVWGTLASMLIVDLCFIKPIARSIKGIEDAATEKELKRKREQEQQELKRKQEAEQRKQNIIARARALSRIAKLVSASQISAAKLPLFISEAELSLDLAEREFSEGLYSPFSEAMEHTVYNIILFDETLYSIKAAQQQHAEEAPPLGPGAVSFSLGVSVLPNTSDTNSRMKALYRRAQKDPHFAQIYEQRRTNAILIKGFQSLGHALIHLGDRVESELRSLNSRLDFRLADIESALQDSSKQMGMQHDQLLQTAQSWREETHSGNSELIAIALSNAEQAEKDAGERREYEISTRKMLDNIQRRRKPSLIIL